MFFLFFFTYLHKKFEKKKKRKSHFGQGCWDRNKLRAYYGGLTLFIGVSSFFFIESFEAHKQKKTENALENVKMREDKNMKEME
jgi:hypothetical protein